MRLFNIIGSAAFALAFATTANAASTTIITLGDEDCFGTGQVNCAQGNLFEPTDGVAFPFTPKDRSTALDYPGTDIMGGNGFQDAGLPGPLGELDFDFGLIDLTGMIVTAAIVEIKAVSLDLQSTSTNPPNPINGTEFFFNDRAIGTAFSNGVNNEILDLTFTLMVSDINAGGGNVFTLLPESYFEQFGVFEDYAVDYARLTVGLDDAQPPMPTVPVPGAALMLLSGLGLMGWTRARRKS